MNSVVALPLATHMNDGKSLKNADDMPFGFPLVAQNNRVTFMEALGEL